MIIQEFKSCIHKPHWRNSSSADLFSSCLGKHWFVVESSSCRLSGCDVGDIRDWNRKIIDMATGINGEIINVSKHVKVNLLTNVLFDSNRYHLKLFFHSTVRNHRRCLAHSIICDRLTMLFVNGVFFISAISFSPLIWILWKLCHCLSVFSSLLCCCHLVKNLWLSGIYKSIIVSFIFVTPILFFWNFLLTSV